MDVPTRESEYPKFYGCLAGPPLALIACGVLEMAVWFCVVAPFGFATTNDSPQGQFDFFKLMASAGAVMVFLPLVALVLGAVFGPALMGRLVDWMYYLPPERKQKPAPKGRWL